MSKTLKGILKCIFEFTVVLLTAFFLTRFIIINAYIPSESMENTLMAGDLIFGNRLSGHFSRGDIIIFKHIDDSSRKEVLFIKRVIGEREGKDRKDSCWQVYPEGKKCTFQWEICGIITKSCHNTGWRQCGRPRHKHRGQDRRPACGQGPLFPESHGNN